MSSIAYTLLNAYARLFPLYILKEGLHGLAKLDQSRINKKNKILYNNRFNIILIKTFMLKFRKNKIFLTSTTAK